jgi:hypothetical protein
MLGMSTKLCPDKDGYVISHKDTGERARIHMDWLVAMAWLGPFPEGIPECELLVLHIDGDVNNRHMKNLRYGTKQDIKEKWPRAKYGNIGPRDGEGLDISEVDE